MDKRTEITWMKVRLFRLAQQRWNLGFKECGAVFEKHHIYDIVDEMYDEFHVQGDEANLDEIEDMIGVEEMRIIHG